MCVPPRGGVIDKVKRWIMDKSTTTELQVNPVLLILGPAEIEQSQNADEIEAV